MREADAALHRLFEAHRLLRDAGERIASSVGQTHARRMVLQSAAVGETVPEIARVLGLQRQGVQRIADELVESGLGRYEDNPRHRRSKRFVVTDEGQATLAAIHRAHDAWISSIESEETGINWSTLRSDLDHLVELLANHADQR